MVCPVQVLGQLISDRTSCADDPAGQDCLRVLTSAGSIVDIAHRKMGVAGQHIDVLVCGVSEIEQVTVYLPAAGSALGRIVHAVSGRKAVGKGAVHADNDAADLCVSRGP